MPAFYASMFLYMVLSLAVELRFLYNRQHLSIVKKPQLSIVKSGINGNLVFRVFSSRIILPEFRPVLLKTK